MNISQFKPLK